MNDRTTSTPRLAALRFNPFDPEFRRDPYGVYRRLRLEAPVHRSMGMWVLTRHAEVSAVLKDPRFSSSQIPLLVRRHAQLEPSEVSPLTALASKSIVFTDEPDHTRLRQLVVRALKQRGTEQEQEHIARVATQLIERVRGAGRMDAIADFADRLPLQVMAESMALPAESWQEVQGWTHQLRALLEPGLIARAEMTRTRAVLETAMAYFRHQLAERRRRPGADLISALSAVEVDGDCLDDEEIVFSCLMMFVAGHETTRCLIGNGLLALLEHPEQLERLRREPALISSAVSEMLRFESPLQQTKRRATVPLVIGGQPIAADEQVLLCLGAANRDPERFDCPDRFDIARDDSAHLALGQGMHHCLGGALAQLETQVALRVLLNRLPKLELLSPPVWLDHSFILRGLKTLPIGFEP